jgi:hypothetical protein
MFPTGLIEPTSRQDPPLRDRFEPGRANPRTDQRRDLAELLGSVGGAVTQAADRTAEPDAGAAAGPRLTAAGLPLRPKKPRRQIPTADPTPTTDGTVPSALGSVVLATVTPIGTRPTRRDPVEVRRIMSAYQRGASRGRAQAERGWIAADSVTNPPMADVAVAEDAIAIDRDGTRRDETS